MSSYRTVEGDMIDAISVATYGTEDMVEAIYLANPHLAGLGPILPSGINLTLPERPVRPTATLQRLWGSA